MSEKQFWLLSYDISNKKKLAKTAKLVESKMIRLQRSIYLGKLDSNAVFSLFRVVSELVDEGDKVFMVPICRSEVGKVLTSMKDSIFSLLDSTMQIM